MNVHTNTPTPGNGQLLAYNDTPVATKGEFISLTDLWRSAGSPLDRRPEDWKKDSSHIEFIEHVALVLNTLPTGIWKGIRGNGGGTNAHWQIGLAYAKWLNHDVHMWCNTVVRERMEGKSTVANSQSLTKYDAQVIGNIVKNCTGVVLKERLTALLPAMVASYVAGHHLAVVDGVTAGEVCDLAKIATNYPRGISGRVSRRLGDFCKRKGEEPRVTRMGRVRAQLFPTHIVRDWLDLEGRALIKRWVDERREQKSLRLVGGK